MWHAMSYAGGSTVVMYGGRARHGPGFLADTWEYDVDAHTWQLVAEDGGPGGRNGHAMAYLGGSRVVMFGGWARSGYLRDTWEYDASTHTWTPIAAEGESPPVRGDFPMAHAGEGRAVLFGGSYKMGGAHRNDTWEYDAASRRWQRIDVDGPKPSPRCDAAMAHVGKREVVLFGGWQDRDDAIFNDTWRYNGENRVWTRMEPAPRAALPAVRYIHAMASLGGGAILAFGGNTRTDETWEYDGQARAWHERLKASFLTGFDRVRTDHPRCYRIDTAATVGFGPIFMSADGFGRADTPLRLANLSPLPVRVQAAFRPHETLVALPEASDVSLPPNGAESMDVRVMAARGAPVSNPPPLAVKWNATFAMTDGATRQFESQWACRILEKHDCPRIEHEIVIDGRLDDWPALPFDVVSPEQIRMNAANHTGHEDCRFRFGVSCDADFVYIAVQTVDDRPYLAPSKRVWQQDGVEVRLSAIAEPERSLLCGRLSDQRANALPILVSPGSKPGERLPWQAGKLPKGTKVVCVTAASGHNTEIAVPASYLDEERGAAWTELRLNVAVNDYDEAHSGAQLWWKPDWRTEETYSGSGTFRRR